MEHTWTKLPPKLTPTLKRKIGKDWHEHLPYLTHRKTMVFDRRVGPLLIGVGLQPKFAGEYYEPGFSVHNLSRDMDFLTATLNSPLRTLRNGASESLRVMFHEKNYPEAAERMKSQALLPLEGPISLTLVINAYKDYMARENYDYILDYLEDPALIAAWAGEKEKAQEALEWGTEIFKTWPEFIHEKEGGVEGWRTKMEELISKPEALREITRQQIELHKLTKVVYDDFTDTTYKERP